MQEEVSLREYIEKVLELRFVSTEHALRLQAKEYERRLALLNNEADQLKSMQTTYLPREIFETKMKEIDKKLEELRISKEVIAAKASMPMVILSWVLSIAALITTLASLFGK